MDGEEECPQCGKTERRIEGGTLFCAFCGTSLGPVAFVAEDEEDYPDRGTIIRRKQPKVKQRASKIYRGRKGYRLFLQAWQHILWRQCYAAVQICGLPPELWTLVKDLWALRLTEVRDRFQETKDRDGAETSDPGRLSDISDSGFEAAMSASDNEEKKVGTGISPKPSNSPRLIDSVALLYLATVLLRYPLRLGSLFDWIQDETIPFIRPIRFVPVDIRKHLASEYQRALDTISVPRPSDLQQAALQMITMYGSTFGMAIPKLNYLPLMINYVENLALPLQVYIVAKQLTTIVGTDFTYPTNSETRRLPTTYPEARLMALIVIAVKLLFPFDSDVVKRYPKSLNEPASLYLEWAKWIRAKEMFDKGVTDLNVKVLRPGTEIQVKDIDVMKMNDEQLDQYMNWYQNTFARIQERDEDNVSKKILEMFPAVEMSPPSHQSKVEQHNQRQGRMESLKNMRLQEVLSGLTTPQVISEEDEARMVDEVIPTVLRPGEGYQRFKDATSLAGPALVFHQEAAHLACLTLEQLLQAINHLEQHIEKWRRTQRRSEVWGDDMEVEGMDNGQ